ncbi:UPF0481 protein family [Quillaja saponaria]|uniref:UPF0481 protein family n=1 Tax=Quillaja saponaria TaxID=32244 RepID=A0AAD7LPR3_QUISA|nr:UPF0481 protein family [Quillaja saponaria]
MVHASGRGTASVEHIINIPERIHHLCIYRVPPNLRQVNAKAYTSRHISIGPFHHGKPQFKAMEEQKERYYLEFRKRIKYIHANNKEFADMIELDAVFIMEFFSRLKDRVNYKDDDYVMSKPWLIEGICLYLILLENQLPIKVLIKLYTFLEEEESNTFLDLAYDSDYVISYSATKLRDSDDGIELKLRNLMALEQCYYPDELYNCNYVSLIDGLIETKGDVDFLLEQKVIVNYLGSNDAVAKLVNSFCRELTVSSSCYEAKIKELNAHYENPFNHTMATIRRVYFKDLWRTSSTIGGLAILAFIYCLS